MRASISALGAVMRQKRSSPRLEVVNDTAAARARSTDFTRAKTSLGGTVCVSSRDVWMRRAVGRSRHGWARSGTAMNARASWRNNDRAGGG